MPHGLSRLTAAAVVIVLQELDDGEDQAASRHGTERTRAAPTLGRIR